MGDLGGDLGIGRPFPSRTSILVDILIIIQQPSHSLCNTAIRKIILLKPEDVTDQEYEYLNNHLCSQLLNIFYSFLGEEYDEITRSGIGEFLAQLIYTVGKDDRCREIREDLIEWIVYKLNENGNTFTKFIFTPNYEKFKNIFSALDPNTIDPELREKFRLHLIK